MVPAAGAASAQPGAARPDAAYVAASAARSPSRCASLTVTPGIDGAPADRRINDTTIVVTVA